MFDTAEAMLETIESDTLVVATDPDAHAHLTALGVSHGKHVIPRSRSRSHASNIALSRRHASVTPI